ncbi:MAG: acyl-CoA thioesterase [Prochlorococcaceae cyanobacterium]
MNEPAPTPWLLRRQVLPQHTDHAGVMWHGAYLAWLEEARVGALAEAGLAYSDLSARGFELPVVHLAISYRQALLHGEWVELRTRMLQRRGARFPWHTEFVGGGGRLAAEARVDLVLVDLSGGPARRRLLRTAPAELEQALARLERGPS